MWELGTIPGQQRSRSDKHEELNGNNHPNKPEVNSSLELLEENSAQQTP